MIKKINIYSTKIDNHNNDNNNNNNADDVDGASRERDAQARLRRHCQGSRAENDGTGLR